jgi:gas vesicle protein
MRKVFSFLFGCMLGAPVGAAVATILAPQSGDAMRDQIQLKWDQIVEEGKRAADVQRADLESQLEDLKKGQTPAA